MLKKFFFYLTSFSVVSIMAIFALRLEKPAIVELDNKVTQTVEISPSNYHEIFSSLPDTQQNIITSVKTADSRSEILRQYLAYYQSPLGPQADLIVHLSDQYDFDYRWLVAIAQQESNLCKRIPEDSYNCWGWGIYPDPSNPEFLKVTRFESYEQALVRIAPQFKDIFLKDTHAKNPFEVMKTYTPPSEGSWARAVTQFFSELE